MTEKIVSKGNRPIYILTKECIIKLHGILCDYSDSTLGEERVSPRGVKNEGMLESAIGRQKIGFGDTLKYSDNFSSAATLTFGLVKNHAFHNGNKRTAFLSLIQHLHCNEYMLKSDIDNDQLYNLFLAIAENKNAYQIHSIFGDSLVSKGTPNLNGDDLTIWTISKYFRKLSIKKDKYIRKYIPYKELIQILKNHKIDIQVNGNHIKLTKYNYVLGVRVTKQKIRNFTINQNKEQVSIGLLNSIRNEFELKKDDGFDSSSLYTSDNFINNEITKFKKLIYRLAKT